MSDKKKYIPERCVHCHKVIYQSRGEWIHEDDMFMCGEGDFVATPTPKPVKVKYRGSRKSELLAS